VAGTRSWTAPASYARDIRRAGCVHRDACSSVVTLLAAILPGGARLLLIAFCVSLGTLVLLEVLRVDGLVAWLPGMIAALALVGTSIGIVGHAIVTRRLRNLKGAGIALMVGSLCVLVSAPVHRFVEHITWERRRPELDALVREVLADGRVNSMSSGTRYFKNLNGTSVRDLGGEGALREEPTGPPDAVPVATALRRDGISPERYRRYRAALIRLGYERFEVSPETVIFTEDGWLDATWGELYVRPGQALPRFEGRYQVKPLGTIPLRPLGSSWYSFGRN
jgi:hypothetical protein